MFILIRVSALLLIICTATSCARLTSIFREFTISGKDGISIDAKQRVVISTKDGICAEPSPDAIQSISAALSGSASYQQISASLASSISESAAYVGLRTQTIQLLRDAMYRVCEAHLSGSITHTQYYREIERFRRSMVTLAAIEELTGTVRAPSVVLAGGAAQAGSGKNLVQAQENLQKGIAQEKDAVAAMDKATEQEKSAKAAVDKATAALAEAVKKVDATVVQQDETDLATKRQTAETAAAGAAKTAADLEVKKAEEKLAKDKNTDEIAKLQQDKKQKEDTHQKSLTAAKTATDTVSSAKKNRQILETAASQAAMAVETSTTVGSGTIEPIQNGQRPSDAAVIAIAATIQSLVTAVYTADERTQFCLEYVVDYSLDEKDVSAKFCLAYLKGLTDRLTGTESSEAKGIKELIK